MNLAVSIEQRSGNERFTAQCTLIRPLSGVITLVNNEGGMLGERFATRITGVWLLAGMRPLVNYQGGPLVKGFSTDVANQGFLPTVKPQMVLKGSLRRYGLSAQMTIVFILTGVRLDVYHEGVLVSEGFSTEFALMFHGLEVRVVYLQMPNQGVIVRERLVAGMADVLLSVMLHVHVTVEFCIREKAFIADFAVTSVSFEVSSLMRG